MGVKYHAVCDAFESKIVQFEYALSSENRSDGLTQVMIGEPFVNTVHVSEDLHIILTFSYLFLKMLVGFHVHVTIDC